MRFAIFTVFVALTIFQQNVSAGCADGTTRQNTAKSCSAIYYCNPSSPSEYYYVLGSSGPTRVYCHMDGPCGVTGGWMRVTSLDMKLGSSCPTHFRLEDGDGKRLCVKRVSTGCSSQNYSTGGVPYAEVCGKAIGYQYGSPDTQPWPVGTSRSIEEAYTDGISITHGSTPRKHIWTYMGGYTEDFSISNVYKCPCAAEGIPLSYINFVGNHFYCESGNPSKDWQKKWYLNDPLWDGKGCPRNNSCCANSGMPYFYRTLPRLTTDNIEVRLCTDEARPNEDIGLEELELYVR